MKVITDHKILSRKYTEIKTELDEAEKSLKKLVGCNASDRSSLFSERDKSRSIPSRILLPQENILKRSRDLSESEENASEDNEVPSKKVALRSAVVTSLGNAASKRDVILKQNCNTKIISRNRRMFGMVQNTLQKFQDEAVKRQSQDLKKIKVEQKVEAAEQEEKQSVEKQKLELYSKQKEKQVELECLKKMMELTELLEVWENNQKHLLNYNVTETEPKICFLPARHTPSSKKHLNRSKIKIEEIIERKKEIVERELIKISESYQLITPVAEVRSSLLRDNDCDTKEQVACSSPVKQEYIEEDLCLHLSENETFSD